MTTPLRFPRYAVRLAGRAGDRDPNPGPLLLLGVIVLAAAGYCGVSQVSEMALVLGLLGGLMLLLGLLTARPETEVDPAQGRIRFRASGLLPRGSFSSDLEALWAQEFAGAVQVIARLPGGRRHLLYQGPPGAETEQLTRRLCEALGRPSIWPPWGYVELEPGPQAVRAAFGPVDVLQEGKGWRLRAPRATSDLAVGGCFLGGCLGVPGVLGILAMLGGGGETSGTTLLIFAFLVVAGSIGLLSVVRAMLTPPMEMVIKDGSLSFPTIPGSRSLRADQVEAVVLPEKDMVGRVRSGLGLRLGGQTHVLGGVEDIFVYDLGVALAAVTGAPLELPEK